MRDLKSRLDAEFGLPPASTHDDDDYISPLYAELMNNRAQTSDFYSGPLPRPESPRIFAVSNQKGGVGKTTTAVNIAASLAEGGLRVLVIDADPQGNASTALGVKPPAGDPSVYHVLNGAKHLSEVIYEADGLERVWVVPSTIDLAMAEIELVMSERREYRLREAVDRYLAQDVSTRIDIDYIFIDSPPSLGMLTLNALVAAREVLIPIQAEYYALEGLTQLMGTINSVQQAFNPELQISTILLTMFDKRTNLATDVASDVEQYFPSQLLETRIPRNVRISEAPSFGQTVISYDAKSTGAAAYLSAAKEIAQRALRMNV